MRRFVFILILSLLVNASAAQQNLVPNPSFEQYSSCPGFISEFSNAVPWICATWGTCDYYNSCIGPNGIVSVPLNWIGYQYARTGSGYAGLYAREHIPQGDLGYREYIQTELTDSLIAGTTYCVSFYVSLGDSCTYTVYDIGAYISNTAPTSPLWLPLPCVPQIQNPTGNFITYDGWVEVSGTYTAVGGEKYITIGNFNPNYLPDTLLSIPNTLYPYQSYLYIDDVSVGLCEDPSGDTAVIPNVFTPNGDGVNDVFEINGFDEASFFRCEIYNRWGTKITETYEPGVLWDGKTQAGELCSDGVYYYLIRARMNNIEIDKTGFIQLVH